MNWHKATDELPREGVEVLLKDKCGKHYIGEAINGKLGINLSSGWWDLAVPLQAFEWCYIED